MVYPMKVMVDVQSVSKQFYVRQNRARTLREFLIRRVNGLYQPLKTVMALQDVSFQVPRGQTLGILGHNGAGKSTLLRLICGIGRPTRGSIQCNGSISGLLDLIASFQPLMTGRENIRTAGMLNGLNRRQVRELEEQMIAFSELEQFIDQPVRTYSSGMCLRLGFAAAVHLNPDILVIDEILVVGDIRFRKKCEDHLKRSKQEGKTLILTSHEPGQMRAFCDQVLVLEEGKIAFLGDPHAAIIYYHDLMRQRTEKRSNQILLEPAVKVAPPEQGSRMGTQEVSINEVRLLSEDGQMKQTFTTGKEMMVELEIKLVKPIPDFAVLLGIYTEHDVKCFETHIPSAFDSFGVLNGGGRFQCQLPALPLQIGRYFINVGIYPPNWDFIYDYHWHMHSFEIAEEPSNVSGSVSVRPIWSVTSPN
jgi:lipopolysaccharide transport system ATP-binding protein